MKTRYRVMIMTVFVLIGIALWYPALRSRRVIAQGAGLAGTYGFSATVPYTGNNSRPLALVGVMTFDDAGNVTGSETVVQADPTSNTTPVQSIPVAFIGTYTVNADGSGVVKLSLGPGVDSVVASFVFTDGGSSFMFVQTNGNVLLTGTGRKQ